MLPSGYSDSAGEVEVVQPERLLEDGRVLVLREGEHRLAVVEHVVPADLVGAVGEALRVLVVRGHEQHLRGIRRPAGEHDEVARVRLPLAVVLDDHLGHRRAVGVRLELDDLRVGEELDVRMLEGRPHTEHVRVRLAVDGAGEAVAVRAAHARAVGHVRLVQPDPARRVEGVVPGGGQVVGELLDPRLVRDGRERVRSARVGLGRVLVVSAVHLVEVLRLGVVGLDLVVGDRPGRRDAVVVLELPEVLLPQAVERCAVELRRAARRSSGSAAGTACPARRTRCPRRCSGCRRRRPARASSAARAGASRRAPAAGSACPTAPGAVRACRRRHRFRR